MTYALISICVFLFGFAQVLEFIGLHLLQNLVSFQPLFISVVFFSPVLFFLSFKSSDTIIILAHIPVEMGLGFLFIFDYFICCSIVVFSNSPILSSVLSTFMLRPSVIFFVCFGYYILFTKFMFGYLQFFSDISLLKLFFIFNACL